MGKQQSVRKIIVDIILILFIPVFYLYIAQQYNRYTAEQISIFIEISFLLIIGCLFWGKTEKRNHILKFVMIMILLGLVSCYQFDQRLWILCTINVFCSLCIIVLVKRSVTKGEKKRIFARVLFSLGICSLLFSGNCRALFEKSIQDFDSIYEMEAIDSPDQHYTAVSCMYDNEETERYTVFVKVLEKNTEKEKNVYLTTQDHLNVPMKWISDKTILINGITLDVEKDILDERQRCTNEADRQFLDWKNDKIAVSETAYGSDWSSSVAENDQYIFYVTQDNKIICYDKKNQKKKEITDVENREDGPSVTLQISECCLYYLVGNTLYKCDLDGKNEKQICTGEAVINPTYDYMNWINAVHIDKQDVYLLLQGNAIGRLDVDKKEISIIAEEVYGESCFYQGALFYRSLDGSKICKCDLETLQTQDVRGQEDTKTIYRQILVIGDQLYYTCEQEDGCAELCQYSENGKDEVAFEEEDTENILAGIVTDSSQRMYVCYYSDYDEAYKLKIVDLDREKTEEMTLPEDFAYEGQVIGGSYLYIAEDHEDFYSVFKLD